MEFDRQYTVDSSTTKGLKECTPFNSLRKRKTVYNKKAEFDTISSKLKIGLNYKVKFTVHILVKV